MITVFFRFHSLHDVISFILLIFIFRDLEGKEKFKGQIKKTNISSFIKRILKLTNYIIVFTACLIIHMNMKNVSERKISDFF